MIQQIGVKSLDNSAPLQNQCNYNPMLVLIQFNKLTIFEGISESLCPALWKHLLRTAVGIP